MSTFCNFHCVVVVVCGGDFCVVCVHMRACVCVCVRVYVCVVCVCEQRGVTCTVWVGEAVCVCVVCIHNCPAVVHQFKAVYPQDLE